MVTVVDMMVGWEREDAQHQDAVMTIKLTKASRYEKALWDVGASAPVMCGYKDVSPYRVHCRRQKNKAARRARRRNLKP